MVMPERVAIGFAIFPDSRKQVFRRRWVIPVYDNAAHHAVTGTCAPITTHAAYGPPNIPMYAKILAAGLGQLCLGHRRLRPGDELSPGSSMSREHRPDFFRNIRCPAPLHRFA